MQREPGSRPTELLNVSGIKYSSLYLISDNLTAMRVSQLIPLLMPRLWLPDGRRIECTKSVVKLSSHLRRFRHDYRQLLLD